MVDGEGAIVLTCATSIKRKPSLHSNMGWDKQYEHAQEPTFWILTSTPHFVPSIPSLQCAGWGRQ